MEKIVLYNRQTKEMHGVSYKGDLSEKELIEVLPHATNFLWHHSDLMNNQSIYPDMCISAERNNGISLTVKFPQAERKGTLSSIIGGTKIVTGQKIAIYDSTTKVTHVMRYKGNLTNNELAVAFRTAGIYLFANCSCKSVKLIAEECQEYVKIHSQGNITVETKILGSDRTGTLITLL